ncbi:MAG: glycosyltransferase family 4 protein [Sulfuriferula sp.]
MKLKIAIVLPPKEQYTNQYKGAVALCMADFTAHSRYMASTTIFGGTEADFGPLHYTQVEGWKKWYLRDNYAYARRLLATIKGQGFTHVEVQNRPLIHRYLYKRLPESVALSLHLHNDPQGMKGLQKVGQRQQAVDHSATIYCVSDFIRQRYIAGLERGQDKVQVIHNGIETQNLQKISKEKIILYVGRIIQEKGALPLSAAFTLIAPYLPEWKFIVCGADRFNTVSDYEKKTHKNLAALGQQCQYTGYISHDEVMRYFAKAEIAVIPSVWDEPFGRTVLEAMSGAAAVITSGSGGIKEIVEDTGILVNPVTPEGLAIAIRELAENPLKRTAIQQQGYKRATNFFDIRLVAKQFDDVRDKVFCS